MQRTKAIYRTAQAHWPGPIYRQGHKGLWFTRFYDGFKESWDVDEKARSRWLQSFDGLCGDPDALRKAALRRLELADSVGGISQAFETQWHFVTGLGLPHPVENGFAWHPTLGTPYLCGAAVKGLLRAWVEEHADLDEDEREARSELWFGKPEQAGELIFFDAFPVRTPTVGTDVMTPHMGKWYEKGGKTHSAADAKDVDPADWHSPVPVVFLVVRKASFLFTIAPRHPRHGAEAKAAMDALQYALEEIGAGAKTAVGYGDMAADPPALKDLRDELEAARTKRAKEILLAGMDPFERSLEDVLERAAANNTAPEVALIGGLQRAEWPAEEAVRVAEKAKALMKERGTWRPTSNKKNPAKDHPHQRTLILQKILDDSGTEGT